MALSRTHSKSRRRSSGLSPRQRLLLAGLIASLALGSLWLGGRLLVSAFKSYQASRFLTSWEQQRQIPSEQAWQVGLAAAEQAKAWYPGANGQLEEQLGYFWQWRAQQLSTQHQQVAQLAAQQQAISQFRQATQLRPQWPFAWVGLAYAKLVANELDSEFSHALSLAQVYGPERNPINARVAEIGLIAWDHLTAADQGLVLRSMHKTHAYGPSSRKRLFALASELQRLPWLCRQLADQRAPCPAAKEPPA